MAKLSQSALIGELQQMDPYRFEELIADIWEEQGYKTTVRNKSRDRGVDVEAEKVQPFKQKLLIQAKRYADSNKVKSKEVRNYATLYQQVKEVDTVILVTSSSFTKDAEKLAQDLHVKTIGGDDLATLIKNLGEDWFINKYGFDPDSGKQTEAETIQSQAHYGTNSIQVQNSGMSGNPDQNYNQTIPQNREGTNHEETVIKSATFILGVIVIIFIGGRMTTDFVGGLIMWAFLISWMVFFLWKVFDESELQNMANTDG